MSVNRAVFLDRDGTINVDKNYLHQIEDFEFLPGVIEGLRRLQEAGFKLVIITNQSGIARGLYTEEDFEKLNTWMLQEFSRNKIKIEKVYYCPHLPDAIIPKYKCDCECRKPKTGLFWQAQKDCKIDMNKSFAIGDKLRDLKICEESLCKGFLIGADAYSEIQVKEKESFCCRIQHADNFYEAIDNIIQITIESSMDE